MKTGSISLSQADPELAEQWSKKNALKASEVAARSNSNFLWECELGHEWSASPSNRTNANRTLKCPICSNRKLLKGFNDLATTNPELAKDWNYSKNDLKPEDIGAGTGIKVWWVCEKGHEWFARVVNRKNGVGCLICTNQLLSSGHNDLATRNPELLIEWDYAKNEVKPTHIFPTHNTSVWWKCKNNHSWKARPRKRYKNGSACPDCKRKTSKGECEVAEWLESKDFLLERNKRKLLDGLEIDMFIRDLRIGIEYDGDYWHSLPEKIENDKKKDVLCATKGILLIRVKESEWKTNRPLVEARLGSILGLSNNA